MADGRLVRRVTIASGEVTTLAGNRGDLGQTSAVGTDGIGSAVRFVGASGIVFDRAGSLFVSDAIDHTLRKVVIATGEVTTVAGMHGTQGWVAGVGSAARLSSPRGLAIDSQGNIFIADNGNGAVRKFDPGTGAVTTVAMGLGTADDVLVDPAGNVFVAGGTSPRITKIVPATGMQTTLAGDPLGSAGCTDGTGRFASFSNPTGLALDGSGDLLVADGGCGSIRKVNPTTAVVTTVLGSFQMRGFIDGSTQTTRFVSPSRLVRDVQGNLYVSDEATLRQYSPTSGTVSTLAGLGSKAGASDGVGAAARFSPRLAGLAALTSDRLLIADHGNFTIRQIDLASAQVSTLAGSPYMVGSVDGIGPAARFGNPADIAVSRNGQVFVADGNRIRQLEPSTKEVFTLAGSSTQGTADGVGAAASFTALCGIAADDQGNLYVTDENTVRKVVVATRTVTTLAGSYMAAGAVDGIGSAARFNNPCGLAWDSAGRLLIADFRNHTIRALDLSTNAVTTLAGSAGLSGSSDGTGSEARLSFPLRVNLDMAGMAYISEPGNSLVRTLELRTGQVRTLLGVPRRAGVTLGPLPAGLNRPSGLAVLTARELILVDENSVLSLR